MNAKTLLAISLATTLTACAAGGSFVVNERFFPNGVVVILSDRKVNVSIDGKDDEPKVIVVNREPLKLNGDPNVEVTISFKMQTSGYVFAPLQMSPDPLQWGALKGSAKFGTTTCAFGSDQGELNCTFTPTQRRQANSYVLRVCEVSNPANCIISDPSIMN